MTRTAVAYSDPRPDSKIGRVRTQLMYLHDEHRRDGALPTSVRFLFYELVARSIIAKEGDRPDKIVSEALTDLRLGRHRRRDPFGRGLQRLRDCSRRPARLARRR